MMLAALAALAAAELVSNSTISETQCTGDEEPGASCWVVESTFPRQCACVRNVCPSASISETTNCYICDRGGERGPKGRRRRRRGPPPPAGAGGKRKARRQKPGRHLPRPSCRRLRHLHL